MEYDKEELLRDERSFADFCMLLGMTDEQIAFARIRHQQLKIIESLEKEVKKIEEAHQSGVIE